MFAWPAWPVGFQRMSAGVEGGNKAIRGSREFRGEDLCDTMEIGQGKERLQQVV